MREHPNRPRHRRRPRYRPRHHLRLARSGWRVYGGVRTDVAAKELAGESELITPVELDVTVPEHLVALDRELPEQLDALVNNAGVAVAGPIETLSRADMDRQFDVNVFGPLALTRAVLPRLRRARGRVVFISSINGRVSFPFTGMYNASKYAIEAVADSLRVELRPFAVQVALIEPGVIDTDPWHEMDQIIDELEARLDPEHRALYAPHFAAERQLITKIRKNAKPPEQVAVAVERQLTRRRVRPRTLVGSDARADPWDQGFCCRPAVSTRSGAKASGTRRDSAGSTGVHPPM